MVIYKTFRFLSFFSLIFCGSWLVYGLSDMSWPSALPWQGSGAMGRYLAYMGVAACCVLTFAIFTRRSPLVVGVILSIILCIAVGAAWPLIVAVLFFFSSTVLGHAVLSIFSEEKVKSLIPTCLHTLVGAGVYGSIVCILAHFRINYPGVYGIALILPIFLCRNSSIAFMSSLSTKISQSKGEARSGYWVDVGIVVVALVYLAIALLPEVGFDPLVTHLFVPSQLADRHAWGFDASLYALALIPMLADWIYSINYMLGGEAAARLANLGFVFILLFLVHDLTIWAGGSNIAGRLASLILLSTPLTFLEGSTLHVEGVWAAFFIGATLSILRLTTSEDGNPEKLRVGGMLLGCALATKAITLLLMPPLCGVLIWKWRSWARLEMLWPILTSITALLMIGAVPYVDAWRITGNPVFPFFNKVFQSPFFPLENFKDMRWQVGATTDMLYAMTFHSERYQEARAGAPGFQWLVFLVPSLFMLLGYKCRRGLLLLVIGCTSAAFVFTFTATYFRYIYPATVLMIAAISLIFEKRFCVQVGLGRVVFSASLIAVLILNILFLNAASWYEDFPIRPIFDHTAREEYVRQRLPERAAVDLVNKLNAGDNPVAVISSPFIAGLKSDALLATWHNKRFLNQLLNVQSDTAAFNLLVDRNVDYVILDSNWGRSDGERSPQIGYIESVTSEIATIGRISVRKIDQSLRFRHELLKNPDFKSKDAWLFSKGALYDMATHSVLVSEPAPVTQTITVRGGRHYRNVVAARCAGTTTEGRLQINWHDTKGAFLKADGITFNCSLDWTEHEMTVVAPKEASMAVVYTVGHTDIPLSYRLNSLFE